MSATSSPHTLSKTKQSVCSGLLEAGLLWNLVDLVGSLVGSRKVNGFVDFFSFNVRIEVIFS